MMAPFNRVWAQEKCLITFRYSFLFRGWGFNMPQRGGRQKGGRTLTFFCGHCLVTFKAFSHFGHDLVTLFSLLVAFLPTPFCLPVCGIVRLVFSKFFGIFSCQRGFCSAPKSE